MLALAIYAILASDGVAGPKYGGGAQAPLWYFLVVGIQALTLTFPFSQAMSVTRREFYLGTLLTAALTSAILAAVFVRGRLHRDRHRRLGHERLLLLTSPWIWEAGWWARLARVLRDRDAHVRRSASGPRRSTSGGARSGSRSCSSGSALLLVGAMWLVGRLDAWAEVFAWFGAQGALGLTLWGVLLTARARGDRRS